ncbi:MAG: hypothetical protein JWR32_5397 [Mycobacterium sp.]|jgi:hypothetical protein|nr:hypothetical protein [Mycobacterium sp.]
MIQPLFTQFNEQLGDDLNAGHPRDDYAVYGEQVAAKIAGMTPTSRLLPPTRPTKDQAHWLDRP